MLSAQIIEWFRESQRYFNDQIITDIQAAGSGSLLAMFSLSLIGFVYGILHAIGPGHGKVVVSGYMFANESSLRRGLAIVGFSSLLQACVATGLVLGYYYLLDATRTQAERAGWLLEVASFFLIGGIGLRLMASGVRALWQGRRNSAHAHDGTCCDHPHHHRQHNHDESCGCGHAHAPAPAEISQTKSRWALAALAISIGIRPCTGALFLLFFACLAHMTAAGIVATFAMAAGTAITTGALAVLAVKSRAKALALVSGNEARQRRMAGIFSLCAGGAIFLVALFFIAGFISAGAPVQPVAHPLYKSLQ